MPIASKNTQATLQLRCRLVIQAGLSVCETETGKLKDCYDRIGVAFFNILNAAISEGLAADIDVPLLSKSTKGGNIWDGGDIWAAFKKHKKFIVNILTPLWMDSLTKYGGEPQVPSGKNFQDMLHEVQGKSREAEAMKRLGNRLKTKARRSAAGAAPAAAPTATTADGSPPISPIKGHLIKTLRKDGGAEDGAEAEVESECAEPPAGMSAEAESEMLDTIRQELDEADWECTEWVAFLAHGVAKGTPTETERAHLFPPTAAPPTNSTAAADAKKARKTVSRREQRKAAKTQARKIRNGSKTKSVDKLCKQQAFRNRLSKWSARSDMLKRAYEAESDAEEKAVIKKKYKRSLLDSPPASPSCSNSEVDDE